MTEEKPKRLYFKTYLQMIRNSVGTNMFRNLYVRTSKRGEFDATEGGYNSCAFYVSSILVIFNKLSRIHGLVDSTTKDLQESGWQAVELGKQKAGDILVWEPKKFHEGMIKHIGFYIGDGKAISTSIKTNAVAEHEQNFGEQNRKIEQIFRMTSWDENNA